MLVVKRSVETSGSQDMLEANDSWLEASEEETDLSSAVCGMASPMEKTRKNYVVELIDVKKQILGM